MHSIAKHSRNANYLHCCATGVGVGRAAAGAQRGVGARAPAAGPRGAAPVPGLGKLARGGHAPVAVCPGRSLLRHP